MCYVQKAATSSKWNGIEITTVLHTDRNARCFNIEHY